MRLLLLPLPLLLPLSSLAHRDLIICAANLQISKKLAEHATTTKNLSKRRCARKIVVTIFEW